MYTASLHVLCHGLLPTHDGRLAPYGVPEPLFIRRRIEVRSLLERLRREDREEKQRQRRAQRAERFGSTAESDVSRAW